ncbi:MAG: hypothetical protein ACPL7M_00040 [Bryobacteraceae bacterium]
MGGDQEGDQDATATFCVKITQVKTLVFDLATSLLFVLPGATFEFKNEDDVVRQNHGIDSLSASGNRVFQKQMPAKRRIRRKRRPQDWQLLTPGLQLLGGQLGEGASDDACLAADDQILFVRKKLGNCGRVKCWHMLLV